MNDRDDVLILDHDQTMGFFKYHTPMGDNCAHVWAAPRHKEEPTLNETLINIEIFL